MSEPQPGDVPRGVEGSDVDARRVVVVAAVLLVVLALVTAVIWALLRQWEIPLDAGAHATGDFETDAPRLLPAPLDERGAFAAEKDELLHGYGWADREAGFARIPIELAIDMLAARDAAAAPSMSRDPK